MRERWREGEREWEGGRGGWSEGRRERDAGRKGGWEGGRRKVCVGEIEGERETKDVYVCVCVCTCGGRKGRSTRCLTTSSSHP